jgi:hypothetical protein
MWLAQFVFAPQVFKIPKGLCGHTVYYLGENQSPKESGLKTLRAVRERIMVVSPMGLGTKNHCAGEGEESVGLQGV